MTDRERLIELLKNSKLCSYPFGEQYSDGTIGKIADYLLENGVIVSPETGIGDVSDGYHTFNELYHHRAVLFSFICNTFKDKAWKSKKHDTGDMFDGMFIVGIETPQGQATYHYDINPYWDMFQVKELPNAPKWDGHTPEEAIRRISMLQVDNVIVPPCKPGDTVYILYPQIKYIEKYYVTGIILGDKNDTIQFKGGSVFTIWDKKYDEFFGKTVFFTLEEAEKARAEREGKD